MALRNVKRLRPSGNGAVLLLQEREAVAESHLASRFSGPTKTAMKRLNVNLPVSVWAEVQQLSQASGRSITEIVRLGISLAALVIREREKGNRLVIARADGQAVQEIVIPG